MKIFLIIAGFACSGLCLGQTNSVSKADKLYYTAYYKASGNSLEHHLNRYPARTGTGDHFNPPVISRIYSVPIEYDIRVEEWMTRPFESSYYETNMPVESWMESPFDCNYYEAGPEVESWMTRPFAAGEQLEEDIEVEDWMNAPWI